MAQPKNLITPAMVARLRADFDASHYGHQRRWANACGRPSRMLLTCRQIGSTWYFARERLLAALEGGNDQIVISTNDRSSEIFRQHIYGWVMRVCGVRLRGTLKETVIDRGSDEGGAPLQPVSLFCREGLKWSPVGYHGDVTVQDFFWMHDFAMVHLWAEAVAWHDRFTTTYFSAINDDPHHEGRLIWAGKGDNGRRIGKGEPEDLPRSCLRNGYVGDDGIWRQIVTIEDAVVGGFDLIDPAALYREMSPEDFRSMMMCEFAPSVKERRRHA